MPRARLTREAVVDLAVELVDTDGVDALTLAALASRAGVAVPSLYKHVASLADLRSAVTLVALTEATRRSAAATVGRSGEDALKAWSRAVREFAREHPGLYSYTQRISNDPALGLAQVDAIQIVGAVLRGFGLSEARMVDAMRATRATVHGFVQLEANGGFGMPDDVNASFEALLDILVAGVSSFGAVH